MELLFLYVEQFRGLSQQAFNFSPELLFSATETTSSTKVKKYNLNVTLNPDYVNLFESHVLNLTAIVGKNGAGKSTLLHCLKLLTGQLGMLTSSLIFAIRDTEKDKKQNIKVYHYQGGGVDSMISLNVSVKATLAVKSKYAIKASVPYTIERFGNKGDKINGLDFKFSSICSCYYSNIFDGHPEQLYEGLENLSTNYRVEDFLKKAVLQKTNQVLRKETKIEDLYPSIIAEYHKQERKLTLQFLAYANKRQLNRLPELPRSVVINFNQDDFQYLASTRKYKKLNEVHGIAVVAINQSENIHQNFYNLTTLCTFYYLLRWHNTDISGLFEDTLADAFEQIISDPGSIFPFLRNLLANVNLASVELPKMNVVSNLLGRRFTQAVNSMRFTSGEEYYQGNRTRFEIAIDTKLWPVLSAIDDLSSAEGSSFLEYEWYGGISTGEESILLHYARLYELKSKVKKRPVWLFIDEGDIYYHPERQKMYLSELLGVIKLLFGNNDIQIILTTHSPFIVSDLPTQNLILMKKVDFNCVVVDEKLSTGTFGANIHDLFNESFFIEGALMGDFAKSKIKEVIDWCNGEGHPHKSDEMKRVINLIGEPIVKMKLLELFAKKVGESTELARLQAQEEYIKGRIAKIQKK